MSARRWHRLGRERRGRRRTRPPARGWRAALAAAAVASCLAVPSPAAAQTGDAPGLEAAFAFGWIGGLSFGSADANLRTRTGDDYLLFTTDSRMGGAPAIEARASHGIGRRYAVEGRFGFARPELRTSISGDAEGAPELEVAEQIDQYTFEGALLVLFGGAGRTVRPFVSAGAGYLRQLHEGQTLVEHGVVYHVGGGVRAPFFARQQGAITTAGVRADVRLNLHSGGAALADGLASKVSIAGGVFVGF